MNAPDAAPGELLGLLDAYYDTAPRATAHVEEHGSLVLFVADQGWPFYARPRLTRLGEPTTEEIRTVLARQIELGVPLSLEWVHQTAPSLATNARAAGMTVHECPLLVLGSLAEPRPADGAVKLMGGDDPELGDVGAAIEVAFGTPGTAIGQAGAAERDNAADADGAADRLDFMVDALRAGRTVQAGAFVNDVGAVGGGGHHPRDAVSEITGVGMLPAFRRRGLAAAVAHLLARHALENGVTTVFCGADSSDVARVYERVGFRRIGTTCIAQIG
jgi:ribosomal protein S18 acetylase RimI-like enzyme